LCKLFSLAHYRIVIQTFMDPDTMTLGLLGTLVSYVPSTVYSVLVLLANHKYLFLAHKLTEWENHRWRLSQIHKLTNQNPTHFRTQEQFETFVVAKLILFEFVNTFLALFYIAFVLKDLAMLKNQMFMMLIVLAGVNQLQETLLPVVLRIPSTKKVLNKVREALHHDRV